MSRSSTLSINSRRSGKGDVIFARLKYSEKIKNNKVFFFVLLHNSPLFTKCCLTNLTLKHRSRHLFITILGPSVKPGARVPFSQRVPTLKPCSLDSVLLLLHSLLIVLMNTLSSTRRVIKLSKTNLLFLPSVC